MVTPWGRDGDWLRCALHAHTTNSDGDLAPGELDAHVLAIGVETDPQLPEGRFPGIPDTVAWVLEHGGVPFVAHTSWSGLRTTDFEDCPGLVGIEVYNTGCE